MSATEQSMREALEESFDESEKEDEEAGGSAEDTEISVGDTSEGEAEDVDQSGSGGSGKEEEDSDDKPVSESADSAGDEAPTNTSSTREDVPAPVSWKPATRELWAKLPLDVQREVQRRETEISRGLQQASGHKKMAQEYVSVVKPYEALIRSQNSSPAQAIDNLMSTAARLTMGTAQEKAKVITEIIQNYGVDIEILDSALSGAELPDSQFAPILSQLDKKLAPMNDFMQQFQQTRDTQASEATNKVYEDLERFSQNPKNEFFEDVREDMADFMEFASKRNMQMTLQEAYTKACANHPEVSKVVSQRKAARTARLSEDTGGRKRHAASGVPSGSAASDGKSASGTTSLRDTLNNAIEELE